MTAQFVQLENLINFLCLWEIINYRKKIIYLKKQLKRKRNENIVTMATKKKFKLVANFCRVLIPLCINIGLPISGREHVFYNIVVTRLAGTSCWKSNFCTCSADEVE